MPQTLTGVYDTDVEVMKNMSPKDLAKAMTVSKAMKASVESYVTSLVKAKKFTFKSKLTESLQPLDKKKPSEVLKMWNDGLISK